MGQQQNDYKNNHCFYKTIKSPLAQFGLNKSFWTRLMHSSPVVMILYLGKEGLEVQHKK